MSRGDYVLLFIFATGFFVAGVVWRPAFGDYKNLKDALECTSFLATTVAAAVAIYTLRAWKAQFRHAERFKSLKDLKDAATNLYAFRGYLLAVERRCAHLMINKGLPSAELEEAEVEARERLTSALAAYNRAWSTAVVFFSQEEEQRFSGSAPVFVSRAIDDPLRIITLYANSPGPENRFQFNVSVREITDEARDLYASTVAQLEWMLRQKYKD